jgi:hypothetical protein
MWIATIRDNILFVLVQFFCVDEHVVVVERNGKKLIVPRLLGTRYVLAFDTYRFGSRTATQHGQHVT